MANQDPTFVDLFCGCGGLTLGLQHAGLRALAAVDQDAEAIAVFRNNLPDVPHVLRRDLTTFSPADLEDELGTRRVDVIVGGPPCQGFSTARQRDGANHGRERLVNDERRHLYRDFLRFVEYFQPSMFVIENVPGIRSAGGGEYFTRLQRESRMLGYRVHSQTEDAWELGLPQKRRRQLVFGVRGDIRRFFQATLRPPSKSDSRMPLWAAIGDLPPLAAGEGADEMEYDLDLRKELLRQQGEAASKYLFEVLEIGKSRRLNNHSARPHSLRDLRDFRRLREGETSATAMRLRGVEFEFPYDRGSFKDRFTRQSRHGPCSTIVAHLSKDGLMFIHPTQDRSLTPREAARIQSFPDWFKFPKARTPAFRLIGNAVPPLVAEAIGAAVTEFLWSIDSSRVGTDPQLTLALRGDESKWLPAHHQRELAGEWLLPLLGYDRAELQTVENQLILRAWQAIFGLFPLIHPAGAIDTGSEIEFTVSGSGDWEEVFAPTYVRSGWPVVLVPLGREVQRRLIAKEVSGPEYYFWSTPVAAVASKRSDAIAKPYRRRHRLASS